MLKVLALVAVGLAATTTLAQESMRLGPDGTWRPLEAQQPGPDAELMTRARRLIAEKQTSRAKSELTRWIEAPENARSPWMPEALLLRGNAKLAAGEEFASLYDYERVINDYPGSEVFTAALEKELEVAELYLSGLRKRVFGLRIEPGHPFSEEIILRLNERLPGSRLGEQALMRLADYYYDKRELKMAAETYDVFLSLYPTSTMRSKALQRRVFANIAQFKGPEFDARGLEEARYQIQDFRREFPYEASQLGMSEALTTRLEESQAAQMLHTARWYLDRDDHAAARLTLSRLIRKHPGTGAAAQGLELFLKHGWALPGTPADAPAGAPPAEGTK
jgi:outer membrane protein assembly factor BamD (BamD/ComL family)